MRTDYRALLPHASPRQREMLSAIIAEGTQSKAAKKLGITTKNVEKALRRVRKKAASVDPKLHAQQAPEGYNLRGVSTLLGADGAVKQQWVKTAQTKEDPTAFLDAFKAAVEDNAPRRRTLIPPGRSHDADLLTVYPMGDPHLGMLSWKLETGDDFDLKIAERNLISAVDKLVELAPPSKRALIVNLGDFLHADSAASTTTAGTRVDTDSRYAKVLRAGITTLVRCVDRALQKHSCVRVINEIGNHDTSTSVMLAICLDSHYRNNPRVEIDISPAKFHWYEFGQNLLGVTHGDTVKPDALPGIMAVDQREAWGRTQFRYWYTGHVHHQSVREYPGCLVESFRTLAAKDAWHTAQGYRSGRAMVCDVIDKARGRIMRHEVGVEALG